MNSLLWIALAIVVIFVVAGLAAGLFLRVVPAKQAATLPYAKRKYFFSPAERSFYEVLRSVVGGEMMIFSKVGLLDLIYVVRGTESRLSHHNRIQSKHVDFVLCSLPSISPALVIELDDSSHDRPDRQKRDAFVDMALQSAGLAILHVKARQSYNQLELANQIQTALTNAANSL